MGSKETMMPTKLTRYAQQPDGRRNLGVDVGGTVNVLVMPQSEEAQADADRVAALILDHHAEMERLTTALAAANDALSKVQAKLAVVDAALDSALRGTRRFFGRVLMKPATPGAWDGAVWLLDPEKQERGSGIRFASVADVRMTYPELWVSGMTPDGVLLDASPLPVETPTPR